jgi:hypothetical protein
MEDLNVPEAFASQVAELSILFDCGGAFDCAKDTIEHFFHCRSGPWKLGIVCQDAARSHLSVHTYHFTPNYPRDPIIQTPPNLIFMLVFGG